MLLTLDQKYQELETPILVSLALGMFSIIKCTFQMFRMQIYISYHWLLLFFSGLGQCYDTTFAFNMVLGPADLPEGGLDAQLVDQVGLLPLGQQKWDKTSKARDADDPKFFCWWGSVPRNLWLHSLQRRQELLSSTIEYVQRQCTCTCCYIASCTKDLRTTHHYGS